MRIPLSTGRSLAAATTLALAVLASTCVLAAPDTSASPGLLFHPVPLPPSGSDSATDLTRQPAGGEAVDMARFEESSIDSYLHDITALQAASGPYATALPQQLLGLALLHQQQGQHEEALAALDRAAAVSRVNDGLYSTWQITLAGHAIDSLLALGRHDDVEARHHFLVNQHRQHYGQAAPETATALQGLGEWQLEAFHLSLEQPDSGQMQAAGVPTGTFTDYQIHNTRFERLRAAQASFVEAIRILIESEAWTHPALFELERELIRTFYLDANRELVSANPRSWLPGDESTRARIHKRSNDMALPEDYRKGQDAYNRMLGYLKKNPDTTIEQIAEVMLGLADWHLLFGEHARAEQQYRLLEKLMIQAQTPPAVMNEILQPAVPVALPAFAESAISASSLQDEEAWSGYVDLALQLNRHGHAGRIEILGASPGTEDNITAELVGMLRKARFRPMAEEGAATRVRYYYMN